MNLIVAFIEDRRLGLAAVGALAIVAGSILPWIRVSQPLVGVATGYGLSDDGKVTIVLGLLAFFLLLAYARLRQRDLAALAGLLGLGAAGLAAAYISDLNRNAARVVARLLGGNQGPIDPGQVNVTFPAQRGVGIYVIFAGAAVLVVAAAALTLRGRGTTEPARQASA